ncbi:MAG: hypothetical protein WCF84_18760 [Anaerolineae bacterium]
MSDQWENDSAEQQIARQEAWGSKLRQLQAQLDTMTKRAEKAERQVFDSDSAADASLVSAQQVEHERDDALRWARAWKQAAKTWRRLDDRDFKARLESMFPASSFTDRTVRVRLILDDQRLRDIESAAQRVVAAAQTGFWLHTPAEREEFMRLSAEIAKLRDALIRFYPCPRCEGQKFDKGNCGMCNNKGYLLPEQGRETNTNPYSKGSVEYKVFRMAQQRGWKPVADEFKDLNGSWGNIAQQAPWERWARELGYKPSQCHLTWDAWLLREFKVNNASELKARFRQIVMQANPEYAAAPQK